MDFNSLEERINFNNFNGDNNKNTRKFNLQVEAGNTTSDYVPYRGRSNNLLTEDVDSIKNDLGGLSFSVSGTTLSIIDGTNTWTLTQ